MNVKLILATSLQIIAAYSNHTTPLQEFEVLAYVQACRVSEILLRDFREAWEGNNNLLSDSDEPIKD